jgi:hypothetical protein
MVENGLKKSHYLEFNEWNEIYSGKIDADILIQGSSRAWRQVDPRLIDSTIGLNSFNLGMDGYQIPMQIARSKIYRQHNTKPKCIVQILDHFSLTRRSDLFNMEQFLPYLNDTILKKELFRYKGLNYADFVIPYFKYIGSQETAIVGFFESTGLKKSHSTRYKGFESENKTWEPDFDLEKEKNPSGKRANISIQVIREFDAFLEASKKENVEIVLVYSPEYYEFQDYILNRDTVSEIYRALATKYDYSYIDYEMDSLCFDKKYFYNPTHLNSLGAELFSRDLAGKLDSILK